MDEAIDAAVLGIYLGAAFANNAADALEASCSSGDRPSTILALANRAAAQVTLTRADLLTMPVAKPMSRTSLVEIAEFVR